MMELQRDLQDHIRTNSGRPTLDEIMDADPAAVGDTIKEDALALTDELHEALQKVGWKSWAKERGVIDRDAYLREMVDALFFWLNLVNIVDASADEISEIYREKWERNWKRYSDGNYSMVEGKCAGCGDDFGDIVARGGNPYSINGFCTECAAKNG
jgi:NTP pyrophosphatase (non-canonical NTP hydrolase)